MADVAASGRHTRPGRTVLLRTAIELMGEQGYDGTSTRDIAAAVGVSVAALYHHFPSKLDVLREFLFEAYDVVVQRIRREVGAAGPDPRAQLDAAVAVLISANLHDRFAQLACTVAWRESARLPEADRAVVQAKREAIVDVIETILRSGSAGRVFPTADPIPVAWAILALCTSAVERYPTMGMTMAEIIELHQRFALALASTAPSAGSGTAPRRRARRVATS